MATPAVVAKRVFGRIMAGPVGQDIRHAGLGGRPHELADGIARSRYRFGDDLLACCP